MSPIAIGVLAVSMSVDAFIAALGKGAWGGAPARGSHLGSALKTGAVFGVVEAITPLIGWALGVAAGPYVDAVDHWIAFGLLGLVGAHMLWRALRPPSPEDAPKLNTNWAIFATAVGSSIDAMAIGVSLAFLDVNIFVVAFAIGFTTFLLSTAGLLAGRFLGRRFGRIVEAVGGAALIALGALILHEHIA